MLFGINAAASGHVIRAKLNPPSRLKKIGAARRKRLIRQSLHHAIGTNLHMAQTTVREDYIRPVSVLAQYNPDMCARTLTDNLDLLTILLEDPIQAKEIVKAIEKEKKDAEKAQKTIIKKKDKEKEPEGIASASPVDTKGQTRFHTLDTSISPTDPKSEAESESEQKQADLFSFG
jgi:hypothetical protein